MISLSKEEILNLFLSKETAQYKKRGRFLAREAVIGESVLTIVAGKLETIKRVEDLGSYVLRNIEIGSSAEMYIVAKDTYLKRYDTVNEYHTIDKYSWQVVVAKGEIDAFEYHGETIKFIAPWNEEMLCEEGDYIARPVGGKADDIYRIEKDTFSQTYSLK